MARVIALCTAGFELGFRKSSGMEKLPQVINLLPGHVPYDAFGDCMGVHRAVESWGRHVSHHGLLQDVWPVFVQFRTHVHQHRQVGHFFDRNF